MLGGISVQCDAVLISESVEGLVIWGGGSIEHSAALSSIFSCDTTVSVLSTESVGIAVV